MLKKIMADKKKTSLSDIKLLVLDVDGVMTDGTIIINSDGSESKFFNTLDGHGIRMWQKAGFKVAVLSGRTSAPTKHRCSQLDIDYCVQNCFDKLPGLQKLLEELSLSPKEAAYIGDDLPDLPAMRYVGFGAAVANAADEVKQYADYVTTRAGGSGAVREVIEHILKSTGKWNGLVQEYSKN